MSQSCSISLINLSFFGGIKKIVQRVGPHVARSLKGAVMAKAKKAAKKAVKKAAKKVAKKLTRAQQGAQEARERESQ